MHQMRLTSTEENTYYRIAGKFGEFGKSSAVCQTKTIQTFRSNNSSHNNFTFSREGTRVLECLGS